MAGRKNQFNLSDKQIEAAAKTGREKTQKAYAEKADIIAKGYPTSSKKTAASGSSNTGKKNQFSGKRTTGDGATRVDQVMAAAINSTLSAFQKLAADNTSSTGSLSMGESARAAINEAKTAKKEGRQVRPGQAQRKAEQDKIKSFNDGWARDFKQKLLEGAQKSAESAYESERHAKEGLGKFGQGVVDFGIAGAQFAGDALLNAVAPGAGLAAMAGRAYGSASLDAQQRGLSEGEQQISGLKSAAIEMLTEKLFGSVSKVAYGKGIIRNESLVNSLVNRLAKTDRGRTALKVLVGANEEGMEEVLSDILNPIADRILKLDDGKGDWSDLADDYDTQQMLEDYIIGGALGLVGAGTNVVSGQYRAENAQQRAYEEYQRQLVNAGLATEQGGDAQLTAEKYKNILDQSTQRGKRNLSDKETENLESLIRGTYAQEDASDVRTRLAQLGTDVSEQTVNAIVKAVNGETLSRAEQKAFDANPYSQRVVNEMLDAEGVTSNEWYAGRASTQSFTPEVSSGINKERAQNVLNTSTANYPQFVNSMARQYEVAPEVVERTYNLNPTAPQAFETAFNAVYQMGQQGTDKAALGKVPVLSTAQANIAYQMGADSVMSTETTAPVTNNNTQEVNDNGVRIHNVAERINGQNTEGQIRGVETGTGENVAGRSQKEQGGAVAAQIKAGEKVSYKGKQQKGVYYAAEDTEDMKKGRKLAESYGYKVTYFVGGNIRYAGGEFRGAVDTAKKTVMVRADHPDYTAEQIMRHEMGHAAFENGDLSIDEAREMLLDEFTADEINELIEIYNSEYGGILSAEEAFEEICCDALGRMNIFEGTDLNSESYEKAQNTVRKYAADKTGSKGRAPPKGGVMFSRQAEDKYFARQIDQWDGKDHGGAFRVGGVSEPLLKVGIPNTDIWFDQSKAAKQLLEKGEITKAVIKQIPVILQHPIAISESYDNTVMVFGQVFDATGNPIVVALRVNSTKRRNSITLVNKIRSVGSRSHNLDKLLNDSNILYLGENKKETKAWFNALGRSTPFGGTKFGLIRSVSFADTAVKKFSMEAPIEQKKNLIALHNLDETKLLKTLKLGGFPMPSIAITKSDIPHTNFGNITVVFGKETVDPKFDRRNIVYSADAWTPLFPRMEYEANEKAAQRIRRKYYELEKKHGHDFVSPLYESANYLDDTLTKNGGVEGLIDKFADDTRMMQIYLADTGRTPVESVKTETITRLTDNQIELYDALINTLGADVLNEMAAKHNESPLAARKAWFAKHGDALKAAFEQYYTKNGIDAKTAKSVVDAMKPAELIKEATNARKYLKDGAETRKTEVDIDATNIAIRKAVDSGEYIKWLNDLYGDAVKDSGFYNNKDYYTSSGNRRSFKATHYPNTLDGIVKAMASQGDGNSRNVMGFHGVKSLRAGIAERFKSVEDMHKLEGRLKHLTAEEASQISDALDSRLSELMHDIYNLVPHSGYSNEFLELDSIGEVFMEATELKYVSPANVKALFKKYNYPLTDKMASDIVALLFDVNNMPVNIFEAKPERAVGFDEIRKVIIPDTSSDELRTALKNAGIESVEEYAAGDDAARMKIANDVPNVHFSREPVSDSAYMKAVERGDTESAQRMVDEAAKKAGYTVKMYHGSKRGGGFTVFRDWSYFTKSKKYAQRYTESGNDKSLYSAYVKIENAFDTRKAADRYLFDEIRQEYGMGEIQDTGLPDWTDGYDIADYIDENGLNYDAIILDEGGDLVDGKPISRGLSYVIRNSNNIKSAEPITYDNNGNVIPLSERFKDNNPDIRYSREPERLNELRRQNERKLAQATAEDAANENERGLIRDYQKQYSKVEGIREKLSAAQQTLTEAEDSGADYDTTTKAKNRFTVLSNQYAREHRKLESYAKMKALQNVLTRVDERLGNDLPEGMGAASANFTGEETVGERWVTEAQGKGDSALHPISKEQEANLAEQQQRAPQEIPKEDLNGKLTSKHVSTIANSGMTPAEFSDALREDAALGKFSHIAYSDEEALKKANRTIEIDGWEQALANYKAEINSGRVSKDNTVMGIALYNNAVNSGDYATAMDIASLMVKNSTNTAQSLQAMRILNKLSPECRLYLAAKSIENIEEDLNERYKDNKADIHVDKILYDEYAKALRQGDEDGIKTAWANIEQSVAQQINATWYEKLNNFRYLAMLGNPRTHVRNIVGNAFFVPVRAVKNTIAYGLENIADAKINGGIERSKAILNSSNAADAALVKYAMSDYEAVQEVILSGGKYVDTFQGIDKHRTIYKTKILEAARKGNSAALDAEDAWFCKPAYANALAKWYKANGITAEQLNTGKVPEETIIKAQTTAIKEAQKATYRDTNWFSAQVSRLGKVDNKVAAMLIEGVLPFKKTPANILARAVEYSPVGLIKSLALDTKKVKAYVNGDIENGISPAEFIDDVSAGLTGSALMGLGILLASWGVLSGGDDDDEKQNYFDELSGKQNYALSIGGMSITLDWLAPESMPLFVGVELFNSLSSKNEDKGFLQNLMSSVMSLSTPMFEMSMLQSVNDLFDNLAYIKQGQGTFKIVSSMAANYISQYFPTLFGQGERAFGETQRETTYVDRNSAVGSELQYMWGKIANKIPFYDFSQIPYIDAWGRTEETGNLFERMLNNFVNPAYVKKERPTEIDGELERLYDLGETSVYPSRAKTNTKINGEYLTADEYVKYATTKGQTSYELAQGVINSAAYSGAADPEKAYMLKYVYSYADHIAKYEVNNDYSLAKWEMAAYKSANPMQAIIDHAREYYNPDKEN